MKKEPPEIELPAVIPVTDSHGDLLPILFLVDPGESFQWGQEENDPQVIHKLSNISQEERLHVLLTYLDLVKVTITPKPKDSVSGGSSGVDDRRSTADSNESESSSGGKSDSTKKSGLGRHMKSVRQKLKRSISKLTRRTSEENDVGLAKGNQGGTMEKNCVRAKSNERSNGEVSVSVNDVEVRIGGNENGAVSENASFVWKVDTVKDAQCAGHLANPNVVLGELCTRSVLFSMRLRKKLFSQDFLERKGHILSMNWFSPLVALGEANLISQSYRLRGDCHRSRFNFALFLRTFNLKRGKRSADH